MRIAGELDLEAKSFQPHLKFEDCEVVNTLNLRQAKAPNIHMVDCIFHEALIAEQMVIHWNLNLDGSTLHKGIALGGARIGGQVSLCRANLAKSGGGVAFDAHGLEVSKGIFLRDGFTATGGLTLVGAKIGGPLSMTGAKLVADDARGIALAGDRIEVTGGVFCDELSVHGQVRLPGARIGGQLSMPGATLKSAGHGNGAGSVVFSADQAHIAGGMFCSGLSAVGETRLLGATIGGQLLLNGATLDAGDGNEDALSADGIDVAGDMFLRERFTAKGQVRLLGAKIGGQLSLKEAQLEGVRGEDGARSVPALNADRASVAGGVFCGAIAAKGEVRFLGAKIGAHLSLSKATLEGAEEAEEVWGAALNADRIEVAGDFFCNQITSKGEVRLLGGVIGGQLSLHRAVLEGAKDSDGATDALSADDIEVTGSLFFDELSATGDVRLIGAKVGGQLALQDARLEARPGGDGSEDALSADRIEVAGGVFCDRLNAVGQVRLLGATIDQQLSMDGAVLTGTRRSDGGPDTALNADGVTIGGNVFLRDGFTALGEVRFPGAKLGAQLALSGATLDSGGSSCALSVVGSEVDELILAFEEINGCVDLRSTSVRSLWDAGNGQLAGRLPKKLRLEGFSYRSLREPLDADQRLDWLAPSQSERYYPGVYAELVRLFRNMGHHGDARKVAIASERRAVRDCGRWSFRRIWSNLLWVTIGYGYRDWLAALWIVTLIGIGAVLFSMEKGAFVVTSAHPPPFNPVLYAIDTTVPVLDLGQRAARSATGCLVWAALFLTIAGYGLVAAVIAAGAGLFNRDHA